MHFHAAPSHPLWTSYIYAVPKLQCRVMFEGIESALCRVQPVMTALSGFKFCGPVCSK